MILEKFFTNKYDNDEIFVEKNVKFSEFKDYVFYQKNEFEKSEIADVALLCENYFDFAVNFFAAIFAKKNIYLLTDKSRLNLLDFSYIKPENFDKKMSWKSFKNDYNSKEIMINFFTSGSSGIPKLIGKTLYNLEVEAQSALDEFNLKKDLLVVSTTLSSHSYGIAFNFILPFYSGMKIFQTRIEFPEQLPKSSNYIFISTPSFVEKFEKYDYKFENPPEKVFLAGAKTEEKIYKYFNKFSKVIDIYGSTETGNIAYKNDGEIFTVLEGVCVEKNEEGKIVVKSDFFPEKEIILNDIIEKFSDKKFILKKRTDRIVKVQEKRISLTEIENISKNFSHVKDACCFKYEDVLACAIVVDDENFDIKLLKKYLSDFVEIVPKKWRILSEIPKNISGKIDYEKLKFFFGLNLTLPYIFEKNLDVNVAKIVLKFRKNSNFLKGHFDIKPIVPGVVQLYFAKYFIQEIFKKNLPTNNVKKLKFSNIINPEEKVTLRIIETEKSFEISYLSDDKIYSSCIFEK